MLASYASKFPDSITAVNLRACNYFKMYNGEAAERDLRILMDKLQNGAENKFAEELLKHNLVVFRKGKGALQVLPGLVDVIPEARLNLVIYHLRNGDSKAALQLIKTLQPSTPSEYVLKGIVYAMLSQEEENGEEFSILAQDIFQQLGNSPDERDTIPGRQCMGSNFFLLRQYQDVLIYFDSIQVFPFVL